MEDNDLIEECWLAGVGDRRKLAEGAYELFFRQHPHDTDREYLKHVFTEIRKIPAATELFAEGKTPLWAIDPSGDAARRLLEFFREIDAENGGLKRSFATTEATTQPLVDVYQGLTPQARFLGDLYQDLSEHARKKYALLQTPEFVEQFILDRTLTYALNEFGLKNLRLIDATCGSGHFLLGAFDRLFHEWMKPEWGVNNSVVAAQNALDSVCGVDINSFAIAITRFRLLLAAVSACGIKKLHQQSYAWKLNLATGDSLLWGSKPTFNNERLPITHQGNLFEVDPILAVEDPVALRTILGQGYHVVVGNPPYIIVRDRAQNAAYRQLYSTCHQKYSLGVPFTQRFWELAIRKGERIKESSETVSPGAGYIGMITANSFMKREFGKKLIEDFFPKIDLTHVIDTAGAYIPGHGTPTVILFGRSHKPVGETVRAVLGIKGEPTTPEDASQGLVWRSIVKQIDKAGLQDDFTSTADVPRTSFYNHPWSIGGGGAAELKEQIEESTESTLAGLVTSIGFASFPGLDEAFVLDAQTCRRLHVNPKLVRGFVFGETVRDWRVDSDGVALTPYDNKFSLVKYDATAGWGKHLWCFRTCLEGVVSFGGRTRKESGDDWWGWYRWIPDKYRTTLSITFAEVASHNHFVLDRGGKVFKQTAPVLKLSTDAAESDHLALLGLLNSSTACFYMKQVSHQKQMTGGDGVRVTSRAKVPYQFAGTRLEELPIPESFKEGPMRSRLEQLASKIDECATRLGNLSASIAIDTGIQGGEAQITALLQEYETERSRLRSTMIFQQEEIDFTAYVMFGLADKSLLCDEWEWTNVLLEVGQRPFELLQQRNVDDYPVPKGIPAEWPKPLQTLWRKRMDAIKQSKDLSLIEDDHYKRRWIGRQGLFNQTARQNELKTACENWLLDKLESLSHDSSSELTTVARLADKASRNAEFMQIAALFRGRPDFNVNALVAELVESEAVPFLPVLCYKPTGLRKRELWERTWDLQRKEDAGKKVGEIPVPPKYIDKDFLKPNYKRLRGTLDVPKERWVSYPYCQTESDPTLVICWAGWNHLQQATALVAYYDARKREGWNAKQLTPLLAGLDQLLPWIHQWHPEIDKEFNETAGQSFQTMLEHDAHELGLTLEEIRQWTPPPPPPGRGRKRK